MRTTALLVILMLSFSVYASKEVDDAKSSLKALIGPILLKPSKKDIKKALDKFSVEKCQSHKINWMNVLLMRETVTLTYTFKPGCDIEGSIQPAVIKTFPADLKLRNLESFTRLQSQNKITAGLETKPVLNLAVRQATLTGSKGKVLFEADYAIRINPLDRESPVEENLGGEIRISEIYGKKVSIKEKILVD